MNPTFSERQVAAFSLCEVTVALGILTFCLVSLLGLLPVALQSVRDSMDVSVSVELADRMAHDLRQQPFGVLPEGGSTSTVYFDERGELLPSSAHAAYQARKQLVIANESTNLLNLRISLSRVGNPSSQRHFCYLIFNND